MAPGLKTRTFALLLYLTATVLAYENHYRSESISQALQIRQTVCSVSQPISCAAVDPNLPQTFCCAANTACISIDKSSSALCCPNNGSCTAIEVISCDVKLQDPARTSTGPVVTTRLSDKLPTCGNACCPFGYTCERRSDGSSFCQLVLSRAIMSSGPSSSSTSSTSAQASRTSPGTKVPTSTTSNTPTMQASGIGSTKSQTASPQTSSFPPGVFLAGFFPGILIGALSVLAWVILTNRHRKPNGVRVGSEYGKRPEISDPYGESKSGRTDFSSGTKSLGRSVFTRRDPTGSPGLPFDSAEGWKNLTPPANNIIPVPGVRIPAGPGARIAPIGAGYSESDARFTGPIVNDIGYPMTPNRTRSFGHDGNATGEILLSYTPQKPAAAVPPLRGMSSQRRSRDSGVGTGFGVEQSPSHMARAPYPALEDDESADDANGPETLFPMRYQNNQGFQRGPTVMEGGVKDNKPPRPETTFTEMLRQINFPDPLNDRNAPGVPTVPKEFR